MLGAGGLVRAYGRAVSETVTQVWFVERQPRHRLDVSIGYEDAGRVEHAIRTSPYAIADIVYGESQVTFVLYLERALLRIVEAWIAEITNGKAGDVIWIDVPITGAADPDPDQ